MATHRSKPSALHLVPCDGIGGVESAVRSMRYQVYDDIIFDVCFIASQDFTSADNPKANINKRRPENTLSCYVKTLSYLYNRKPEVLIASLWRSYLIMIIYRVLRPRCRIVCFIHCSSSVHLADFCASIISMAMAKEIWVDSHATLSSRIPERWKHKSRIISYVLDRPRPVSSVAVEPKFLFWGRLSPQKGLSLALMIISEVRRHLPMVKFLIIGPDNGEKQNLSFLVKDLHLEDSVRFLGPKTRDEISAYASQASFYLQPSLFEGMAVSVVEAMQLGLVPVVTPVGEIAHYCRDEQNALLIDSDNLSLTVHRILSVISSPARYVFLRDRAISTWCGSPLYRQDVINGCRELLAS